jgi:hypothetical protein
MTPFVREIFIRVRLPDHLRQFVHRLRFWLGRGDLAQSGVEFIDALVGPKLAGLIAEFFDLRLFSYAEDYVSLY